MVFRQCGARLHLLHWTLFFVMFNMWKENVSNWSKAWLLYNIYIYLNALLLFLRISQFFSASKCYLKFTSLLINHYILLLLIAYASPNFLLLYNATMANLVPYYCTTPLSHSFPCHFTGTTSQSILSTVQWLSLLWFIVKFQWLAG